MSKNKKIVLITVAVIIVLAIIVGLVCWKTLGTKTENNDLNGGTSKVSKLYSQLKETQAYSFTTTLDDENKTYYAKKGNVAYLNTNYQGKESKFIIKNGNSYLLVDDEKLYYTYQNNETDLEKITLQLETIKDKECVEGKEEIKSKNYKYEEYEGYAEFLVKDVTAKEKQTAKTRFYFNGNKLEYIKTIVGDYQEILKVDISYDVDDNLFEIPADYQEA